MSTHLKGHPMRKILVGLSLCGLGAVSCAGSQSAAPPASSAPATAAPATGEAVVGPPQTAWDAMNKDQRKAYMKAVVMPKMKDLFVGLDATHYASFNCMTCHGAGAADGSFKMPNPQLPKLPATPEGFKQLAADKPAVAQFMMTKVKPTMASLLGEPEFTPQNPKGFGCFECHTKQ
jgi:hypothetical protein